MIDTPTPDEQGSDAGGGAERGVTFEGTEVDAWFSGAEWHLRAGGHEVGNPHLGEATRIRFNPQFHDDTSPLIHAILAREATVSSPPAEGRRYVEGVLGAVVPAAAR